jgi:hypothetical protein
VEGPLAPGARRKIRAPLPTAALIAGVFFCALAVFVAARRPLTRELVSDALVVRALGATMWFAGFMLVRVSLQAAVGLRRIAGLVVGAAPMALATALLISPALAAVPFDRGWGLLVPWLLGLPGILALGLSRWRVS